ncbi:heterodisulfide reductase-related iron-sulfur binding cluster, partial [Candidatus Aminicenantes bacterium AC-335-L06]|nr:heterodisulfide reductase-related iron-sulfur binding cluster [Candidatus Aminicenantes bacterium AC-335-L06]
PTSAPSSTVGGWLAQGGGGIGSYEYGWFRENVISARVVLLNGKTKEFKGEDLDLISEAEGTTGLISSLTLRVKPLESEEVIGVSFKNLDELSNFLNSIDKEKLPLWSISFSNPEMVDLRKKMPPKLEHGIPIHENIPHPPAEYFVTLVYPKSRSEEISSKLNLIIKNNNGNIIDKKTTEHEWSERFKIMKIKRLAPSLIPAEVVIPLKSLGKFLNDIKLKVSLPFYLEGMLVKTNNEPAECIILGFFIHDERKFSFNLAYLLTLRIKKLAQKYGGRIYSTGAYFQKDAKRIFGSKRLLKLKSFKREIDPLNLLNPGKVIQKNSLTPLISLAEKLESPFRPLSSILKAKPREKFESRRGIPGDIVWYAYACAQCGYCVHTCDEYYGHKWESHSPRGKWYYLRKVIEGKLKLSQEMVDKFLICTTCEMCNVRCPLELPIETSWAMLRGELINKRKFMTFPPFEIMSASLKKEGNIWASYRKDRTAWIPKDLKSKILERGEWGYFAGCTASYVEQDIGEGTLRLLDKAGIDVTMLGNEENCCGLPMLVAGLWDVWIENMKKNIDSAKRKGIKKIITSCPACWLSWHTYYPQWAEKLEIDYDIETYHYSQIIAEKIKEGKIKFSKKIPIKITWHDSCHIGRAGGIYDPPREIIKAIPGVEFVEMEHNREEALCCGSVLTLIGNPPVAHEIGDIRIEEAYKAGAEAILAACPCCEFQLRVSADKMKRDIKIYDLGHFVAKSLGINMKDPTPYALSMWAVFEKMVFLMKPEGMADLMIELFPQLMDAMPGIMKSMMKFMKRLPSPIRNVMFSMMKPVMPKMFPVLLPKMMPKVMPHMLKAVEKRVPMPQHMKEQMPDLMPKVMDNLMPKMLPSVIPLIINPLIEFIKYKW